MGKLEHKLIETHFQLLSSIKNEIRFDTTVSSLTFVQMNALMRLKEENRPCVSEFAKYFRVAIPTATVLLDKLAGLQLIAKKEDSHDRRVTRIQLTQKGERLLKEGMKGRERILTQYFARLSAKDKKDFLRIMRKIVQ